MSEMLSRRVRKWVYLFSGTLVLAFAVPAQADPKPLTKEEQAKVDQAIDKGVAFLKKVQTKEGDWPRHWPQGYLVGQCALAAYSLLEAGVAPDDPVIRKAAVFLRPKALKTDRTYELALALLFFDRLGDPQDKKLLRSLALRLIAGQHRTGGWSYRCLTVSEANEAPLLQSIEKLNKHITEGGNTNREAMRELGIPRALSSLTIFQDPKKNTWLERETSYANRSLSLADSTDNSNTQFALLGLWAAQRHGVPVEPTFQVMVERFERTQAANGGWSYGLDPKGDLTYVKRHPSMICVGVLGLAIGRGLKLPTPGASQPGAADLRVLKGVAALSQDIGDAAAGLDRTDDIQRGGYYLWSVERVAMLFDLPTIGDKDWYRWGAGIFLASQKPSGAWEKVAVTAKDRVPQWGPMIDTSFALLFLKRSNPVKELTPQLSLKGKELNKGIARLIGGVPPLEPSAISQSRGNKSNR